MYNKGMITNRTGQVKKANTAKLVYALMAEPNAVAILKATSTSMMLKSDDTCKRRKKNMVESYEFFSKLTCNEVVIISYSAEHPSHRC